MKEKKKSEKALRIIVAGGQSNLFVIFIDLFYINDD